MMSALHSEAGSSRGSSKNYIAHWRGMQQAAGSSRNNGGVHGSWGWGCGTVVSALFAVLVAGGRGMASVAAQSVLSGEWT